MSFFKLTLLPVRRPGASLMDELKPCPGAGGGTFLTEATSKESGRRIRLHALQIEFADLAPNRHFAAQRIAGKPQIELHRRSLEHHVIALHRTAAERKPLLLLARPAATRERIALLLERDEKRAVTKHAGPLPRDVGVLPEPRRRGPQQCTGEFHLSLIRIAAAVCSIDFYSSGSGFPFAVGNATPSSLAMVGAISRFTIGSSLALCFTP